MKTKTCIKCEQTLPATTEYFPPRKTAKTGLRGYCRECTRLESKKFKNANKDKIRKQNAIYNKKHKARKAILRARYYKLTKSKIKLQEASPCRFEHKIVQDILIYEDVSCDKDGFASFQCAYCGKPFLPTRSAIKRRMDVIRGTRGGELRLYCSDGCKESCPIYGKIKYPGRYRKASSREANPILRQLVLKRDNYTCQKCGSTECLHCHHVTPAKQNPMTANDPDVCITLCKSCHKEVHRQDCCKYNELRCKE